MVVYMDTKQVAPPLQAMQLNEALGTGSGYLSTFGNTDLQRDVIFRGAFLKSIARLEASRRARGGRYLMPLLFQHSADLPCGGFTLLKEDSYGLYAEFEIDMSIELGRRVFSALKKQYVGGFSIGFKVINSAMNRRDGVRDLLELDLIEASCVTFPANTLATPIADSMKSAYSNAWAGRLIRDMARTVYEHPTNRMWVEEFNEDVKCTINRYGGARKEGRKTMANAKIGKLYLSRDYGTKTAAEALHVPEESLKAWLAQEERGDGLVKTPRGGSFVYPAWELAQIVQSHGYDVNLIDTRPAGAKAGTPESARAEAGQYRIERGREDESWQVLERSFRRDLREQDPDLYLLHGKAYDREIARRKQEHDARWQQMTNALADDRRELAETMAKRDMTQNFTPEQYADAYGLDVAWVKGWFGRYVGSELVTPVDAATMTLRGSDIQKMARRDHEMLEAKFVQVAHKRAERRAA